VERLTTALKGNGGASAGALTDDAGEGSSSTDKGSNGSSGCGSINWLGQWLVQSPTVLNNAIRSGYTPALRTEAQGWEQDCGICDSTALAPGCSFCNHVYHNTAQCIKAPNIASAESLAAGSGSDWACSLCWKGTCQKAVGVLLAPPQPVARARKRKRRRTQRPKGK
jgi:hypothetical protein